MSHAIVSGANYRRDRAAAGSRSTSALYSAGQLAVTRVRLLNR